ncbi:MAG: hypothetical protein KDA52_13355 [Planctomycetaceae bacterium]|nr:hypothetical protein [Planctomycetaceae bacterium]
MAAEKNAYCLTTEWLPYYGPNPPMEARMAFNEYVKCRWPIHVFALDPEEQDQNVASGFSLRREMQLLLALSASQRRVSLQSLTQFVRRLEYDLETIALNKTAIGFTHGNDTFGWRFYPRVQVPEVEGNLQAAFHDLIGGGPDLDDRLEDYRLEPGIRECTALVVMPSFVPNVILDTRSDWFRLADHHDVFPPRFLKRKGDVRDAVDLSAEVVKLRQLSHECVNDAHLYREGEVHRLQRAVLTLDRQLPLQTAFVEMPYENLLGGFDLFNSSVLGLKPTLRGWYGAPGIVVKEGDIAVRALASRVAALRAQESEMKAIYAAALLRNPSDPDLAAMLKGIEPVTAALKVAVTDFEAIRGLPTVNTTLYLVGKNFSVLDTRVIAGGVEIPDEYVRLISRDVIQITVPSTVSPITENGRPYVDVHLATPYGPTPRLRIPVANDYPDSVSTADAAAKQAVLSAKEAKASAAQAIAASPGFEWGATELTLKYAVGEKTEPPSPDSLYPLQWNSDNKAYVKYKKTSPFGITEKGQPTGEPSVEAAFYLSVKYEGDATPHPVVIEPGSEQKMPFIIDGPFDPNLVPNQTLLTYKVGDRLLARINEHIMDRNKVEELLVECFLRPRESSGDALHYDSLPIVRLADLKMKVIKPPRATSTDGTDTPAVEAADVSVFTPFSSSPQILRTSQRTTWRAE